MLHLLRTEAGNRITMCDEPVPPREHDKPNPILDKPDPTQPVCGVCVTALIGSATGRLKEVHL